jgi:ribonuclease BN (tRNA processing enzyme)
MVKLTVVGCSPAWPNPGGAHSGYLLEHDGHRLLVDCGPGVLARLRRKEDWPRIDAIAITHFHLDHCGDLVAWLWGHLHVVNGNAPAPHLWLPPGGRADLDNLASRFGDVFPIHEYADAEPFEAAGFSVIPHAVSHYTEPTYGFRIEAGGKVLAYSADTGPTPALDVLAREADLFLCEATLDEPETGQRGHLAASEASAAALRAHAKRLLLVHRGVELAAPDGLEVAHDGLELKL